MGDQAYNHRHRAGFCLTGLSTLGLVASALGVSAVLWVLIVAVL